MITGANLCSKSIKTWVRRIFTKFMILFAYGGNKGNRTQEGKREASPLFVNLYFFYKQKKSPPNDKILTFAIIGR